MRRWALIRVLKGVAGARNGVAAVSKAPLRPMSRDSIGWAWKASAGRYRTAAAASVTASLGRRVTPSAARASRLSPDGSAWGSKGAGSPGSRPGSRSMSETKSSTPVTPSIIAWWTLV